MRTICIVAGFLTATPALAEVTTTIQNGSNRATLTQSGDPATVQKKIEQSAGHTRIDQKSGTNSMSIIQDGPGSTDSGPPDASSDDEDTSSADFGTDDHALAKQNSTKKQMDVIDAVRKGAPPQSRRNLDELLERMGMRKSGK